MLARAIPRALVPLLLSRLRHVGIRLYSDNHKKPDDGQEPANDDKQMARKEDHQIGDFKVKRQTLPAAPAPTDGQGIEMLMKRQQKPYIPRSQHQRLSYEYPSLPNEDTVGQTKPKTVTRWTRYLPKIITAVVVLWGAYMVKVWVYPSEEEEQAQDMLDPQKFHTFIVTHKEQIDDDHFLVELVPKLKHWQYLYYVNYNEKLPWNGDRMWLVEVQQPDISVVRSYTPLPLYFMKSEYTRLGERAPLLRVIDDDSSDYDKGGSMCLYVKRYNDGEVLRYITNRKVGDELLLRGPDIDFKLPYHPARAHYNRPTFRDLPLKVEAENGVENIYKRFKLPPHDNLVFYGAGTGIAPILQVLMSRNPYRGFVTIHYSARKPGELGPLDRFLFFLEKLDRVKVVRHYDSNHTQLKPKDFPTPAKPQYESAMRLEQQEKKAEAQGDVSSAEKLRNRMKILEEEDRKQAREAPLETERGLYYANALAQAQETLDQPKAPAALSVVCGPSGYVDYVSGSKLINGEQGPVTGQLGAHGWDNSNTFKLQ